MITIGITGGVGAGKSCILNYLRNNYNCVIVMADDLAKDLCKPGRECFDELVSVLGIDVLGDDGCIDNRKMASKIFGNDDLRNQVNSIIHPAVKRNIIATIDNLRKAKSTDFFFLEAALLIEDGYKQILDELWYIYTDVAVRRERLKQSRGYSDEKIDSIISSQLTEAEFRENCDFVIDNSGTEERSFEQIRKRISKYGIIAE